jgi:hypothetical protein
MFEDLQNFGVVIKLANTVPNVRQDLRVQGSREAAVNIGHAKEQSQESVLVYNHLLMDLRYKAIEVRSLAIKLL